MKQLVNDKKGKFFHVHNRGWHEQDIFIDHRDYFRFSILLYCCNNELPVSTKNARSVGANFYGLDDIKRGKPLVDIISHSMMPNRFHLLLREKTPGNLSKFMSKLSTGYTMYFNQKYKRGGRVLAGPYNSLEVTSDAYLKYLFAYIHLKPLKHRAIRKRSHPKYLSDDRIKDSLRRYEYSSYLDYLEEGRRRRLILDTSVYNKLFKNYFNFEQNIFEWLRFDKTKDLNDQPDLFKVLI